MFSVVKILEIDHIWPPSRFSYSATRHIFLTILGRNASQFVTHHPENSVASFLDPLREWYSLVNRTQGCLSKCSELQTFANLFYLLLTWHCYAAGLLFHCSLLPIGKLIQEFWKTRVWSKWLECKVFFRNTCSSLSFPCFMRGKGGVLRYLHNICIFFASVSCVNSVHMKRVSVNSGDILANWQTFLLMLKLKFISK